MESHEINQRVVISQNAPAPYRIALFSRISDLLNLAVIYNTTSKIDREWQLDQEEKYDALDLKGMVITLMGKRMTIINPLKLFSRLRRIRPTHIILIDDYRCYLSNLVYMFYARFNQAELIWWCSQIDTVHGRGKFPGLLRKILDTVTRLQARYCSKFISYGTKSQDLYEKRWSIFKPHVIGTQCVAETEVTPDRQSINGELSFCYIGKIATEKGVDLLLEAFGRYLREKSATHLHLHILGNGPQLDSLKEQYRETDQIIFYGFCGAEERDDILKRMDALIHPSLHDPWALVANEAAQLGVPVVITDACGAADNLVINKKCGLVVQPNDSGSLYEAIASIDANPEKLTQWGEEILSNLNENYSIDICAKRFKDVIDADGC